jgi:hypothetical protein
MSSKNSSSRMVGRGRGFDLDEEDPGKGALPSRPRGQKATKADLKRDASALPLKKILQVMMDKKEEAIVKRGRSVNETKMPPVPAPLASQNKPY